MASARFRPRQRLRRPAEFKRVFAQPHTAAARSVVLLARSNNLGYARLGLAVPKRRIRSAAARNRIKRLARESFRHRAADLGSCDYVLLARSGLGQLSTEQVFAILDRLWQDIGRQCKSSSSC